MGSIVLSLFKSALGKSDDVFRVVAVSGRSEKPSGRRRRSRGRRCRRFAAPDDDARQNIKNIGEEETSQSDRDDDYDDDAIIIIIIIIIIIFETTTTTTTRPMSR